MKKMIQICGDPTVDWFRIHNEEIIVRGGVYYWKKPKEDFKVRLSSKPGGSAMILQLVNEMVSAEIAEVKGTILEEELLNRPKDERITTSWTVWRPVSYTHLRAHETGRNLVCRLLLEKK